MQEKKYQVAVTLPLTLWVEVNAASKAEAIEKAKDIAINTPSDEWGDDISTMTFEIVN